MLLNYLITSFRNLIKRWPYTLVNLIGLALGLTCFIFLFSFILFMESTDDFQPNKDEVYTTILEIYNGSDIENKRTTVMPAFGNTVKNEITGIKHLTRFHRQYTNNVKNNHLASVENDVIYADADVFKMFKIDLIKGNPDKVLNEPFSMVITQKTAKRYFPNEDPIGKQLEVGNEFGNEKYTITGIAQNFPLNTNFGFDFLCSFNSPYRGAKWFLESWTWNIFSTYISFEDGYSKEDILAQFPEYIKKYKTEKVADGKTWKFRFEPVSLYHLRNYTSKSSEKEPVIFNRIIKILALLIVIISWVNYVNLSTAGASERAKEVGIRKAIGASKKQIVKQFLIEASILNITASLLAVGLSFLFFNAFSELLNAGFTIDLLYSKTIWIYLFGITITGIIASGLYPSLILGSFKSIEVLKTKSVTSPASNKVRKILVGVQFFISMAFITATTVLVHQSEHERSIPLGIDFSKKITISGPKFIKKEDYVKKYPSFVDQLKELSEINNVSASNQVPPFAGFNTNIWLVSEGKKSQKVAVIQGIDENYLPSYKIKLLAGRNFKNLSTGSKDEIILSKKTAKRLGFNTPETALGEKLQIKGFKGKIFDVVGIVDNYKYYVSNSNLEGNILIQNTGYMEAPSSYTIAINSMATLGSTQEKIKAVFDRNFPNDIFESSILSDNYKEVLKNQASMRNLSLVFSILAIILAFVGVFGLASFIALLKTKEIGLRKLFGAEVKNIAWVLSKEFVIILTIVTLIVVPALFFLMRMYLSMFTSQISLGVWHFSVAILGVGLIILFVVAFNLRKVLKNNPVKSLEV